MHWGSHGFNSWSEHVPRFRVQSQVGCVWEIANGCTSHPCFSLSFPPSLSKINFKDKEEKEKSFLIGIREFAISKSGFFALLHSNAYNIISEMNIEKKEINIE